MQTPLSQLPLFPELPETGGGGLGEILFYRSLQTLHPQVPGKIKGMFYKDLFIFLYSMAMKGSPFLSSEHVMLMYAIEKMKQCHSWGHMVFCITFDWDWEKH